MVEGLRERERMSDLLGRFVSPPVARLVLSRPLALSGESKLLSILFTDLRDFTTLTEQNDPVDVIRGLNAYFQIVVEAADRYGGVVNKFGGDSTLVLFGLTGERDGARASAEAAVRAALAIRQGMDALNRRRAEAKLPVLAAGIGINTGAVIAGLIGAERRMEYTVIGDAVNLSARIQALNRELDSDILISEATFAALDGPRGPRAIDRGVHQVKGKSSGVRVYAVEQWRHADET
jgi:adenylate cyclase